MKTNFDYSKKLLHACADSSVPLIYASSAAVYGRGTSFAESEDHEYPLNAYAFSKQLFDSYVRKEVARISSQVVALRYFNVYGPNEEHKGDMRSVVSKAFAQIQGTGGMTLFRSHRPDYEDGKQQRDFLYVKDATRMTLFLAENDQANGLFNLGCAEARTWLDLAHAIFVALDRDPTITFVDMPKAIRDKYQYHTQADVSKLRAAGYRDALFNLEEAVCDYVRNYLLPDKRLGE